MLVATGFHGPDLLRMLRGSDVAMKDVHLWVHFYVPWCELRSRNYALHLLWLLAKAHPQTLRYRYKDSNVDVHNVLVSSGGTPVHCSSCNMSCLKLPFDIFAGEPLHTAKDAKEAYAQVCGLLNCTKAKSPGSVPA